MSAAETRPSPPSERPGVEAGAGQPAAAGHRQREPHTHRRGFFARTASRLFGSWLGIGFVCLAATQLMWLLGLLRFMFPNVLFEPPMRFKAGFPDTYEPGQVETRFKTRYGAWIVRGVYQGQAQIYALKAVCTHLGCTPIWLDGEQKFKCPCHGSGFARDGVNLEGPAPRPLERFAIRIAEDGQLEVDKSRAFRQELGQWEDEDSRVLV